MGLDERWEQVTRGLDEEYQLVGDRRHRILFGLGVEYPNPFGQTAEGCVLGNATMEEVSTIQEAVGNFIDELEENYSFTEDEDIPLSESYGDAPDVAVEAIDRLSQLGLKFVAVMMHQDGETSVILNGEVNGLDLWGIRGWTSEQVMNAQLEAMLGNLPPG